MFLITWNDSNRQYSVSAADIGAARQAYWAIKKMIEDKSPFGDCYMSIFDENRINQKKQGCACDPRKGVSLPPTIDGGPCRILLKKGGE